MLLHIFLPPAEALALRELFRKLIRRKDAVSHESPLAVVSG
jgi:hypothetical protein